MINGRQEARISTVSTMLADWQTESEASIRNATLLEAYSTATQSLKISINYLILKQIHFNHENEVCYK